MFFPILNAKRLYGEEPGIKPSFGGKRRVSGDPILATKILWLDKAFNNGHHPGKGDINGTTTVTTAFTEARKRKRGQSVKMVGKRRR